jgi:hypothetical protein
MPYLQSRKRKKGKKMNKPRTEKAKQLAKYGTYIGAICGVPFYEHPTLGDECPLLYITKNGKAKLSDWWELPDPIEFSECGPVDAFHTIGEA